MIFENPFVAGFSALPMITGGKSRAVNAENPRGEKGRGGMAVSYTHLFRQFCDSSGIDFG